MSDLSAQEHDEQWAKYARHVRAREADSMLLQMPRHLLHIDGLPKTAFDDALRDWEFGSPGTVLSGPTGEGKTTAVMRLVYRLLCRYVNDASKTHRGWGIVWCGAFSLGSARRNSPLGACPELLTKAERATLLVIDDMGREDARDFVIPEVLDARYANNLPTIVTSGFTVEQLADRYSDAVIRRIFQGGKHVERKPKMAPRQEDQ